MKKKKKKKTIHIGGNQNILILYIRRNILQWTREESLKKAWRKLESLKKAWRKLESLKRLHDERERREKGERERREKGELQLKIERKIERAYK